MVEVFYTEFVVFMDDGIVDAGGGGDGFDVECGF